jgi:hypothetical protein
MVITLPQLSQNMFKNGNNYVIYHPGLTHLSEAWARCRMNMMRENSMERIPIPAMEMLTLVYLALYGFLLQLRIC